MTETSHDGNIQANISLSAPPSAVTNFQSTMLLVDLATNTLDGDNVRQYTSSEDVATDLAAGFISSATAAQANAAFGQTARPKITDLKIHAVDLVGGETYAEAPALLRAAGVDFYGVALNVRDATNIEATSLAVETLGKAMMSFQNSDSDWLTTGLPAAFPNMGTRERTIGNYHDEDTQYLDAGTLGAGLAFSPDDKSSPWTMTVGGVNPYTTGLTSGQRTFAQGNNMNVLGTFGSIPNWLDPGVNMAGREIKHMISRDWLEDRLLARTYDAVISLSNDGEPLPVTPGGQVILGTILDSLFKEGVDLGHFVSSSVSYPAITATDRSLRRVRVNGSATFVVGGRLVTYGINLSVEP